ncbi:MAG: hypothetical protein PHC41_03600 [Lachnospiraceae bacterium]|nr:hypothetical protein [Lachnospiraceae bacterium]
MIQFKVKRPHFDIKFLIIFLVLFIKYTGVWGIFIGPIKTFLMIIPITLSLLVLFYRKNLRIKQYPFFFFLIVAIVVTFLTKEVDIILALLLAVIYINDNKDYDNFIKNYVMSAIFFYFLTLILGKIGFVSGNNTVRLISGELIQRNSLGFEHVNAVFKNFLPIFFGVYILALGKSKKKKYVYIFIITVISIILYYYSNSRNGFLTICFFLLFEFLVSRCQSNRINIAIKNITPYMFLIFTIISYIIALTIGNNLGPLSLALSGRPTLWNTLIHNTMFPSLFGLHNQGVDNTYFWLLYYYGIIIYLIYLVTYYFGVKIISQNKKFIGPLIFMGLYSLFENMDILNYNFFIVLEIMEIIRYRNVINHVEQGNKIS